MGTAYLAVLEAINEALVDRGVARKDLPRSFEAYQTALRRHLAIRNGKLLREFDKLYDALHIAGYYHGLIYDTEMVKDALRAARSFIEKIGGPRPPRAAGASAKRTTQGVSSRRSRRSSNPRSVGNTAASLGRPVASFDRMRSSSAATTTDSPPRS